MLLKASLALSLLAGNALATDLPSIKMKGSKFFFPNGTQFFMKGVAYQQDSSAAGATTTSTTFVDPLADEDRCTADVPLLAELGTNLIRTYAIDPTADHSACMKLLQAAGIYVISDLSNPSVSIDRSDPTWDVTLFTHYKAVVDELAQYSNVIGFFAGNEVSNQANNTDASAYVKAAIRDTKAYISENKSRWLGVGYAANDDEDIRDQIASYFNCGDSDQSTDFFGYNIYSWCGDSTFEASGYNRLLEYFADYSVPVFFSEYGCNEPNGAKGRTFTETTALYMDNMTEVLSGGIVYEYFEATNDYGLVNVSDDTVTKMKDFTYLQSKVRAADPTGVTMSSYSATNSAKSCPEVNSTWGASSELPPTPVESACECMVSAASCVPKSGLATSKYSAIFDYICGENSTLCDAIDANSTSGVYGTWSMCTTKQQLTYVLNAYYESQGSSSDACDFDSKATTQTGSGQDNCTAIAEAESYANSTTTSSSSSSSSTADSFAVLGAQISRPLALGGIDIGLYSIAAIFGAAVLTL